MAGMRSTKRAKRTLERLGFVLIDTDGSHYHYRGPNGRKITVVLGHKEISAASRKKTCTLEDIAWSEFEERY